MSISRLQLALATLLACTFAALLGVLLASRAENRADGVLTAGLRGSIRPPQIPPADFSLLDEQGRRVSLAEFRGEVVVLTFLYSTCEDTCPLAADQIKGALNDLGHDVPALAISVDPAGDTPARARRFLVKRRMTGRLRFLLGDRATLAPIWKAYGIAPQRDRFDHTAYVLLIDRDGRQRVGFPVSRLTPEALAHDIAVLESEPA